MILVSSVLSAAIALIEVSLFGFLGNMVDWLSHADRATFWETHGRFLAGMAVVVLLILPVLKFFYESVVHQGVLGGFAMRTRWQAHRYVLRQSMAFFNDDFAGRVATKVMQTAMAVREVVMKIAEVLLYVCIYFTGAVVPVRGDRPAAVGAAAAVARRLPRHHALLHPAPGPHLACAVGRPLDHDRPRRRHLYQHLDGEDVRPCRPRGRLRPREHERTSSIRCTSSCGW